MNRYGAMARSHWARWLPQRYATITDPDSFFSALGLETARQIDELSTELAGDDQPGEGYLAKAGRLTRGRARPRGDQPAAGGQQPAGHRGAQPPAVAEVNAEQEELAQDT